MDPLASFTEPTRTWFRASFLEPTEAQAAGWPAIANGTHTLVHAPTGSGKTLAAFLWALDRLFTQPLPERDDRCRVLYVSPLKALAHDVDRNLRAPLAGIRHAADRLGHPPLPELRTFIRTGDTPGEARRRMQRHPPDLLITTPESLYLLLTSAARQVLRPVRWVIVDEVHAVAGSKRGAHLAVSLERLEEVVEVSPQRIGLSATQRPLETLAGFLGGGALAGDDWVPRPVTIVDVPQRRTLDLGIVVPVEDMAEPAVDPLHPESGRTRSIWPAIYPRLLEEIRAHRSTIVFANSRRIAERICAEVNLLAGEEIARAHHGSVAREQRLHIEEALKRGELRAVVATSSLELGIDMGSVDLVLQVEAPPSVTSGLQRVGRAGHQVEAVSRARIFPKYRGDLLVSAVMAREMVERRVESTRGPDNPLDVLAQQIVAAVVSGIGNADHLYRMVRRAAPYARLGRPLFDETLDMLAGRYPSDLFSELRPRVNWDRESGELTPRPGALQLAVSNAGTIPDRGLYRVILPDGSRVGELDEEMVYESREGDVFLLGSSAWRIERITHDRVEVTPAPGESVARTPFWHGDALGRSPEAGYAVGAFLRRLASLPPDEARVVLSDEYHLDGLAASNLLDYVSEELEQTGALPTDRTLVVERFRDEIGDWRLVLLSPFGARVHAPWALALRQALRRSHGNDVDVIWADDGIAFRFLDSDEPPSPDLVVLPPDEVEALLVDHLGDSALFAARFREAAGRSLLLPRRRPGERTPLWLQRRRSAGLLAVARQFPTFPITLEVYREVLQDDFDLPALRQLLADVESGALRVHPVDLTQPSPFATSLLFAFVATFLYEGDAPLAERKAAALTVDRDLLRELLGEGELRDLIDPEVVAAVELELQHLTERRRAGNADQVHDLLRDLGPLGVEDIDVRSEGIDPSVTLDRLAGQRRVARVTIRGEERWAAMEDLARLRDAQGVQPPPGVAHLFLQPVPDPLGDVVGRYARTHGPFTTAEAADALNLPVAVVETVLARLAEVGRVEAGSYAPGGPGRQWVDREVLRRLKRRSLARLRAEIEPVEPKSLARFLPLWQGVSEEPPSPFSALLDLIDPLAGAPIPASVLERDVLPARFAGVPDSMDRLLLQGELVWIGRGALGSGDGRVALYPRSQVAALWRGPEQPPPEAGQETILEYLERRGASFFADIYRAAGGGDPDQVLERLWDLVWSGHVTNDTLEPVRAYVDRRPRHPPSRRRQLPSRFPPHAGGRWSLTSHLISAPVAETERHAAWARLLLDRHGVVTRAAVAAEAYPGGFAALYPVLTHMEEAGRVRRGYFVEGLGGSQFALPGAVDRLRAAPGAGLMVLAAADPANAYGAALPWPEVDRGRLARDAGAYVFLLGGELIAYLDRGRRNLTVLSGDTDAHRHLGRGLAEVARRHRRTTVTTVNGTPAPQSPLAPTLAEWGFTTAPRGLTYRV